MAATAGYQAGVETSTTQLSYGSEVTWGVVPAVQFKAIRYTSESLSYTKTRQRPAEISGSREAAQGVTTQQQAGGTINFAFSATTFDDFFATVLNNDWGAATVINAIAADLTITNTGGVITMTSTLGTKFTALAVGQWIRTVGFVNAANNGFWYITIKASNQSMTVTGPTSTTAVTETSTTAAQGIRASNLKNGTLFKSLWIQQMFTATLFLEYAGAYVTRMTLQGGIGNFMSGAIDIVAKSEAKAIVNASTGAVTAAPTGRVVDPIAGFIGVYWNEAQLGTAVDQFAMTLENTGAAPEFALGSAASAGMLAGVFQASGTFRAYFNNFNQYDLFTNETIGRLSIVVQDPSGYAYVFCFQAAVLMMTLDSGGPGQPVYASITVEGGPSGANGTFTIDRMPNS